MHFEETRLADWWEVVRIISVLSAAGRIAEWEAG
jgi:hypothetical protein